MRAPADQSLGQILLEWSKGILWFVVPAVTAVIVIAVFWA